MAPNHCQLAGQFFSLITTVLRELALNCNSQEIKKVKEPPRNPNGFLPVLS
jgi:hypothetical protein